MRKNDRLFEIALVIILIIILILAINSSEANAEEPPIAEMRLLNSADISVDDPASESELIAQAVISTLGTDQEETCWGFNATELIRIVANEGGEDFDICFAVATACFNAQRKLCCQYDPVETCRAYQYDISEHHKSELALETAKRAVIDVFAYGLLDESIGNATMFYAPAYGYSEDHEAQIFVTEVHGVRFFEERG